MANGSAGRCIPGRAWAVGARRSHRSSAAFSTTSCPLVGAGPPESDRGRRRAATRRRSPAVIVDRVTGSADIQAMLRTLVEQQTAFLNAQAESMRLQRVLVERLLGVDVAPPAPVAQISAVPAEFFPAPPATPTPAVTPTPASRRLDSRPVTHEGPTSQPSPQDEPSSVGEQPGDHVADAPELHPIAEPASLTTPGGQAEERPDNGAAGRGERYYRAQRPAGTAPRAR